MAIEFTKADQQLIQKACKLATEVGAKQAKFEQHITKVVTENLSEIVSKTVQQAMRQQDRQRRQNFKPVEKFGGTDAFIHEPNDAEVIVHFKEVDGALPLSDEQKRIVSIEFGKVIKQMAEQKGFDKLEIKYKKNGN